MQGPLLQAFLPFQAILLQPSTRRSCLCSILSLGQASEAQLVQSSPLQSSAGELLSDLANSTVVLPLAFANVSSVRHACLWYRLS